METISAVTLLSAAINNTESLYRFLSTLPPASSHVESLGSAIKTLESLVSQIQKSSVFVDTDEFGINQLERLVAEYESDIKGFESELREGFGAVGNVGGDTRLDERYSRSRGVRKKKRKVVRVLSGENDILRFLGEVTERCVGLGVRVNMWHYNATLKWAGKRKETEPVLPKSLGSELGINEILRKQSKALEVVDGKVKNLQCDVKTMAKQVERMGNDDIMALLLVIQSQISSLLNRSEHSLQVESTNGDVRLANSIERLRNLASRKEGYVFGEDAESIVKNLDYILEIASTLPDFNAIPTSHQKFVFRKTELVTAREIERLRNIMASSHIVRLSSKAHQPSQLSLHRATQTRKTWSTSMQRCDVTVTLNEIELQPPNKENKSQPSTTEYTARLNIQERASSPITLTACLRWSQQCDGFTSLNPVLSIGKTLPDTSSIFSVISSGDIDTLRWLLGRRECSLRDRDTFGTPLLHYAMAHPEMCKFLIDSGADIEEAAPRVSFRDDISTPVAEHVFDIYREDGEFLQGIIKCRQLLLDAGADPTLPMTSGENAVVCALAYGTLNSLKVILDHGAPFVDLEDVQSAERTALLTLAWNNSSGYNAEKFRLLLDRGANIHARDREGYTCLHMAVREAIAPPGPLDQVERELDAIVLLIERGADIFTKNYAGRSIFEDAYKCHLEGYSTQGGYRGDLWDAALARSGYDSYVRRRRIGHSTMEYTQAHFERLWKGYEHPCPYFSSPLVPCSCLIGFCELDMGGEEEMT